MRKGVARSIAAVIASDDRLPRREPERSALERKVLYGDGDVLPLKLAECDCDRIRGSRSSCDFPSSDPSSV